jgi:hypothetical protein
VVVGTVGSESAPGVQPMRRAQPPKAISTRRSDLGMRDLLLFTTSERVIA